MIQILIFKKIIFKNRYVELETPPFMEKTILNFHFDYLSPSLKQNYFFAIFHQTHEFVFCKKKSSHNSQKIGKWKKRDKTNINLRGRKKRVGGVCHRQYGSQNLRIYKCYEICFYMQKSKISILSPLIIISKLTF